jgi:toxin ParE1/3/4
MRYWFHAAARRELLDSVRYYESQQPGLGGRFLETVTDTMHRIQAHPSRYPLISESWRQCRIPRFPFGIIYRIKDRRIEIIAVMHLHRKPGYWRNRATNQ